MSGSDGFPPPRGGILEDDSHFLNDASGGGEPVEEDAVVDEDDLLDFSGESGDQLVSVHDHLDRQTPFDIRYNQGYVFSIDSCLYDLRRFGRFPIIHEFFKKRGTPREWYVRDYTDMGHIHRLAAVTPEEVEEVLKIFKDCSNFDRDLSILLTAEFVGDPRRCLSSFPDFTEEELLKRFDFIVSNRTVLKILGRHYALMPPARKAEFMSRIPFDLADTNTIMSNSAPSNFEELCGLQDQLSQPHDLSAVFNFCESFESTCCFADSRREVLSTNFSTNKTLLVNEPLHLVLRYLTSGAMNHSKRAFDKFYKSLEWDAFCCSELQTPPDQFYTVYFRDQRIPISVRQAFFFYNGETLHCRTTSLTRTENAVYLYAFAIFVEPAAGLYRVSNLSQLPLFVETEVVGTNLSKTLKSSNMFSMFFVDTLDATAPVFSFVVMPNKNAVLPNGLVSMASERFEKTAEPSEDEAPVEEEKPKKKKRKKGHHKRRRDPLEFMQPGSSRSPTKRRRSIPTVTLSSASPSPKKKRMDDNTMSADLFALRANHLDRLIRPVPHAMKIPPEKVTVSTPLPKFVIDDVNKHLKDATYDFEGMDKNWKPQVKPLLADHLKLISEVKPKETGSNPAEPRIHKFAISHGEGFAHAIQKRRVEGVAPIRFSTKESSVNIYKDEEKRNEAGDDALDSKPFVFHPRKLKPGDCLNKIGSNLDWYQEKDDSFSGFGRARPSKTKATSNRSPKSSESKPIVYSVKIASTPVNDVDFMDIDESGLLTHALTPLTLTPAPLEDHIDEFDGQHLLGLPGGGTIVAEGEDLFVLGINHLGLQKVRFFAEHEEQDDLDFMSPMELSDDSYEAGDVVGIGDKYYYFNGHNFNELSGAEVQAMHNGESADYIVPNQNSIGANQMSFQPSGGSQYGQQMPVFVQNRQASNVTDSQGSVYVVYQDPNGQASATSQQLSVPVASTGASDGLQRQSNALPGTSTQKGKRSNSTSRNRSARSNAIIQPYGSAAVNAAIAMSNSVANYSGLVPSSGVNTGRQNTAQNSGVSSLYLPASTTTGSTGTRFTAQYYRNPAPAPMTTGATFQMTGAQPSIAYSAGTTTASRQVPAAGVRYFRGNAPNSSLPSTNTNAASAPATDANESRGI